MADRVIDARLVGFQCTSFTNDSGRAVSLVVQVDAKSGFPKGLDDWLRLSPADRTQLDDDLRMSVASKAIHEIERNFLSDTAPATGKSGSHG